MLSQDDEYTYSPPKPTHEDDEYTYSVPKTAKVSPDWGNKDIETPQWGDAPKPKWKAPKRYPTPVDERDTGFDKTDDEALAEHGLSPEEIKGLGNTRGSAWLLSKLGKGSFLGDASDTRMGREATGLMDLPLGAAQLFANVTGQGKVANAAMKIRENLIKENQSDQTKSEMVMGGDPLRGVGNMLLPLPGPVGAAGKAKTFAQLVKGGMRQGVATGAMTGLASPVTDTSKQGYWGQKAEDTAEGAGAGVLLGGALSGASRLLGGHVKTPVGKGTPDVNPSAILSDLQGSLQSKVAMEARELQTIAANGGARASEAERLLKEMADIGDDVGKQAQFGMKVQFLRDKLVKDAPYEAIKTAAGNIVVDMPEAVKALDAQIGKLGKKLVPASQAVVDELMEIRNNFARGGHSYEDAAEAVSDLAGRVRKIYEASNTGKSGVKEAEMVVQAMKDDLLKAVKEQKPNLVPLLEYANENYSKHIRKWKDYRPTDRILDTQETDKIIDTLTAGDSADRAKLIKASLSEAGQEALKIQIVKRAIEKGSDANGVVSPQQMVQALKKSQKEAGVLFDGLDLQRLKGLQMVMETSIKKSGSVGGALAGSVPGYFMGGPVGAVLGAGAGGLLGKAKSVRGLHMTDLAAEKISQFYLTPRGQRMLLEISQYNPKSPQYKRLYDAIVQKASQGGGVVAAEDNNPAPRQQAIDFLKGDDQTLQ